MSEVVSEREGDLRVFDEAHRPVRRFLRDLDDLLTAVAVAGLSWPDPDLAADVEALAVRAVALGASEGGARLRAFAAAAETVRQTRGGPERVAAEERGFGALMALVGWVRRFRAEVDLIAVQASLVVRGTSETKRGGREGTTLTVAPVGAELAGERLVIFGLAREDGEPVVLLDRLVEVKEADPAGPVISRLFQAKLPLARILAGDIALIDHPVVRRGGLRQARPAFDAAAAIREPGEPMRPTALDGEPVEAWGEGPVHLPLRFGRQGDRAVVALPCGEDLSVAETAVLRFTATKAGIASILDGGAGLMELFGVCRARKQAVTLLSVETPSGYAFPALDPRAVTLGAGALAEASDPSTPGGVWARAVCRRTQGADEAALAGRVLEADPADMHGAYRIARSARVLGLGIPAAAVGYAAPTLVAVDPEPDDRWRAIWMLLTADRVELHEAELRHCWQRHYETAPASPTPGDLCARAVLMDLLQVGGTEELDPTARAVSYLDAHLAALRLSARAREPRLPSLEALAWLAETRLMLTGDGGATPLKPLDLPPDRLRLAAVDALWEAYGPEGEEGTLGAAGDAVWALRLAGLDRQLLA